MAVHLLFYDGISNINRTFFLMLSRYVLIYICWVGMECHDYPMGVPDHFISVPGLQGGIDTVGCLAKIKKQTIWETFGTILNRRDFSRHIVTWDGSWFHHFTSESGKHGVATQGDSTAGSQNPYFCCHLYLHTYIVWSLDRASTVFYVKFGGLILSLKFDSDYFDRL